MRAKQFIKDPEFRTGPLRRRLRPSRCTITTLAGISDWISIFSLAVLVSWITCWQWVSLWMWSQPPQILA